jgi:hypothetical protein
MKGQRRKLMDNFLTYKATSLSDIADHFDALAHRIEERLQQPGRTTQLSRQVRAAEIRTWREAAHTLRHTTPSDGAEQSSAPSEGEEK